MRQVDQHPARELLPRQLAHLAALVEAVLQDDVDLEFLGVRLVHPEPQQLVALQAGGETGLGEAVPAGNLGDGDAANVGRG